MVGSMDETLHHIHKMKREAGGREGERGLAMGYGFWNLKAHSWGLCNPKGKKSVISMKQGSLAQHNSLTGFSSSF